MNTLQSKSPGKAPMQLWRRFQKWRAMRMYKRVLWHESEAAWLKHRADQLIGRNIRPPMPLFDRLDNDFNQGERR